MKILSLFLIFFLFTLNKANMKMSESELAKSIASDLNILDNLNLMVVPNDILTTTKGNLPREEEKRLQIAADLKARYIDTPSLKTREGLDTREVEKKEGEERPVLDWDTLLLMYAKKELKLSSLTCQSCYSEIGFSIDDCYKGTATNQAQCYETEQCYTLLHPKYISRGCITPSLVGRTFACKCPLCNDKPYDDLTYYTYNTVKDWQFDNERLQKPIVGLDLHCKVCKTHERIHRDSCKTGKSSLITICPAGYICFTTINRLMGYVERGCMAAPAYNSLYTFCNTSNCNNGRYDYLEKESNLALARRRADDNNMWNVSRKDTPNDPQEFNSAVLNLRRWLFCLYSLSLIMIYKNILDTD